MREKIWLKRGLWIFSFLFLWLIFSLSAASYLDPDFGWHFKAGEWIWVHQEVPKTDPFSYTMSNYQWRFHSWLPEIFLYKLYPLINYSGLAVFFGLVAVLAFILPVLTLKFEFVFLPLILAVVANLGSVGVRPKVFSYWLASIVFLILRNSYQKPIQLLFLPFLFLVWANFHGAFLIGLIALGFALATDFYLLLFRKDKKVKKHLQLILITLILAVVFTWFNPYFVSIYKMVHDTQLFGQKAHFKIAEWMPYSSFRPTMFLFVSGFLALVYFFRERLSLFEKITAAFLLVGGLSSQRLMVYFFLFSLPLLVFLLEEAYRLVAKRKRFLKLWRWRRWFLFLFLVFICLSSLFQLRHLRKISEENFYPVKAVAFLQKTRITGNLFSVYNWGGYLIWKLPEKKVFIDGRMPAWEEDGYSAFEESEKIHFGEVDFKPVFEKCSVTTVLLPVEKERKKGLLIAYLEKLLTKERKFSFLDQKLAESGWRLVYRDEIAQVFVEPEETEVF